RRARAARRARPARPARLPARPLAMSLRLTLLPLAVSAALLVPAAAAASVHVPRGQTVQDLKVIGQSIRVDGRALHSVIVVGGNLVVGPTGQVANVTVIGGRLQVTPGARLSGDVYQF